MKILISIIFLNYAILGSLGSTSPKGYIDPLNSIA